MKQTVAAVALIFSLLLASVICAPLLRLRSVAETPPAAPAECSAEAGELWETE